MKYLLFLLLLSSCGFPKVIGTPSKEKNKKELILNAEELCAPNGGLVRIDFNTEIVTRENSWSEWDKVK